MPRNDFNFNLYTLGETRTGKSSILLSHSEEKVESSYNKYEDYHERVKLITIEKFKVKLEILDLSNRYSVLKLIGYSPLKIHGCLLVFDKSKRETFDSLDAWVEVVRKEFKNIFIVIVGNFCDLQPQVTIEEIQQKVSDFQAIYIEVSARTGENIEYMFEMVTRAFIERAIKSRKMRVVK